MMEPLPPPDETLAAAPEADPVLPELLLEADVDKGPLAEEPPPLLLLLPLPPPPPPPPLEVCWLALPALASMWWCTRWPPE